MKNAYKRLVIDTATDDLYLSLVIGEEEAGSVHSAGKQNHSVTIIPMMDELLKKSGLELRDIDEVIVGIGPGSYTGVRIGVSIAKMIGYLNNIQVSTVSSLVLLASSSDETKVVPFIDARRGNAFMALIHQNERTMEVVRDDVLMNVEAFFSGIDSDAVKVEQGKPNILKVLRSNVLQKVENIHDLVPNYLQITEAERHLRSK